MLRHSPTMHQASQSNLQGPLPSVIMCDASETAWHEDALHGQRSEWHGERQPLSLVRGSSTKMTALRPLKR